MTWEAIQRIELCETAERDLGHHEGGDVASSAATCSRSTAGATAGSVFEARAVGRAAPGEAGPLSGPMATFRLSSGRDLLLIVSLHQAADSTLAADIAFRFVQRLSLASAERLERLSRRRPRPSGLEAGGEPVAEGSPARRRPGWSRRPR